MSHDARHAFRATVTPLAGGDPYVIDHEADRRFALSVRLAGGYPCAVIVRGRVAWVGIDGKGWQGPDLRFGTPATVGPSMTQRDAQGRFESAEAQRARVLDAAVREFWMLHPSRRGCGCPGCWAAIRNRFHRLWRCEQGRP